MRSAVLENFLLSRRAGDATAAAAVPPLPDVLGLVHRPWSPPVDAQLLDAGRIAATGALRDFYEAVAARSTHAWTHLTLIACWCGDESVVSVHLEHEGDKPSSQSLSVPSEAGPCMQQLHRQASAACTADLPGLALVADADGNYWLHGLRATVHSTGLLDAATA